MAEAPGAKRLQLASGDADNNNSDNADNNNDTTKDTDNNTDEILAAVLSGLEISDKPEVAEVVAGLRTDDETKVAAGIEKTFVW